MNGHDRKEFLSKLPPGLRDMRIVPPKTTELKVTAFGGMVWVVKLTNRPGQSDRAWKLPLRQWRELEPKHGTRAYWVCTCLEPCLYGKQNPDKPVQLDLFKE